MAPVMSESLDRTLTFREQFNLKLHLSVCRWCVWYFRQLRLLRTTLGRKAETISDDASLTPTLSAEARDRIKRVLNQQDN
jgi:hypothetical protein